MGDVFFTADEHFGHENIIKYCSRPFSNVSENIDTIIKRHNERVPMGSRTYHLGDMFWRTVPVKDAADIIHALNGQHYYIWGNHEDGPMQVPYIAAKFVWTRDTTSVTVKGYPSIWLSHYAHRVWPRSHKGSWHLYGHSHGELEERNLSFDVGVDTNNFYPYSIEDIAKKMQEKIDTGVQHEVAEAMSRNPW